MKLLSLKEIAVRAKRLLQDNSLKNAIWIVNVLPRVCGFDLNGSKVGVLFWITHIAMVSYIYLGGISVYMWKYVDSISGMLKTSLNVSLFVIILNNTMWFIAKRSLLESVLTKIHLLDDLSRSQHTKIKYNNMFKIVTRILLATCFFNCVAEMFTIVTYSNYDPVEHYSLVPCLGLKPLSSSPNYELCAMIVIGQELTSTTVLMTFTALFLVLIAHTTIMFLLLAEDLDHLNNVKISDDQGQLIKKTLHSFIIRHSTILQILNDLQLLYSVPLGINCLSNAINILMLLCLPLEELASFMNVVAYSSLAFFLYCFLCQQVINASEKFTDAVYCCGWENFNKAEMKLVYVMLLQAQKPVGIVALGIIPINMNTYAESLQMIYKFVTVLKL